MTAKVAFPFRSERYERTANWWVRQGGGDGDWALMSRWCDASVGPGKWEFFYNQFVFENEADLALFLLRWA